MHVQIYTQICTVICILSHTETHTHAFIDVATLVCAPCQHHRLALGEEGEGWEAEARVFPSGNWQSPYQRGRAKVRDWWGRSCRLIKKPSSAAVSPLLSCLHCISVSLFSPSCYLASEATLCVEDGREGGRVSCQKDWWTGWSVSLPCQVICPSLWQSCLHHVDLSLFKTVSDTWEGEKKPERQEAGGCSNPLLTSPLTPSIYPSIHPLCVCRWPLLFCK